MLEYAVLAFAIAAIGGLVLARSVLSGRLASWAVSLLHAALGATGLVLAGLAIIQMQTDDRGILPIGLLLLLIAALGGFALASFHIRKIIAPKALVLVHAGAAVLGFLMLAGSLIGVV